VIVLALDTATSATVAAVSAGDGPVSEARDDPPPGSRPGHAGRVLELAEQALAGAGVGWDRLDRLAVGVGPGGFTGLRIGVATGRALAQALDVPLVAVSSLRALALAAREAAGGRAIFALVDARRGEVFAAAWNGGGEPILAPGAYGPEVLTAALTGASGLPLAVGDGALRFAAELRAAGAELPSDGSPLHRIGGAALCELGRAGQIVAREELLPDYLREPDAKPPRLP